MFNVICGVVGSVKRLQITVEQRKELANTFILLCCCNLQCCDSAETQTGFISLLISQSFWPAGETAVTAAGGVGGVLVKAVSK